MTLSDPSGLRPDGICGGNSSTCRPSNSGNEMSVTYHETWQPTGNGWKFNAYEERYGKRIHEQVGGVNWGTVVDLTPRRVKWNWNTLWGAVRNFVSTADLVISNPKLEKAGVPSATDVYDQAVDHFGGDTSDPAYEDGDDLVTLVSLPFTGISGAERGALKGVAKKCANSFVDGTEVLLADGTSKPIEDVKVGDEVLATDPESAETKAEAVTAEIKGQGLKHLVKITIDTNGRSGKRTAAITATDGHPFWVPELGKWIDATDLQSGQWLRTSSGTLVQITAVERRTAPNATVRNLTVGDVHTYYVLAGATPVLVHNSTCPTAINLRPRPAGVGEDWVGRRADNGKGTVWQKPGSAGNADMVRVMDPTDRYPNGYVRFHNRSGQPIGLNGKPGSKADTHIPMNPDGAYPVPVGW